MSKKRIDYCYADPAGNITLLVETAFPAADHPDIASKLLAAEPAAEQVGFVESFFPGGISMRMAGGEFCGNAAFSAAAFAAMKAGAGEGSFSVDFSCTGRLTASIQRTSEDSFCGRIEMPLPEKIFEQQLSFQKTDMLLPVVRFPGITHIICLFPVDRAFAESALKQWCSELGAPAAGIMLLDEEKMSLTPLVYVPKSGTLFWERSCASGTCAAAVWLSSRSGKYGTYIFSEPGGQLGAETGEVSLSLIDSVKLDLRSVEI